MYLVLALLFLLVIPLLHFIFCLLFISFFLSFLMLVIISLSLISLRLHLPVCCFSSRSKINNYCALDLAFVVRESRVETASLPFRVLDGSISFIRIHDPRRGIQERAGLLVSAVVLRGDED